MQTTGSMKVTGPPSDSKRARLASHLSLEMFAKSHIHALALSAPASHKHLIDTISGEGTDGRVHEKGKCDIETLWNSAGREDEDRLDDQSAEEQGVHEKMDLPPPLRGWLVRSRC